MKTAKRCSQPNHLSLRWQSISPVRSNTAQADGIRYWKISIPGEILHWYHFIQIRWLWTYRRLMNAFLSNPNFFLLDPQNLNSLTTVKSDHIRGFQILQTFSTSEFSQMMLLLPKLLSSRVHKEAPQGSDSYICSTGDWGSCDQGGLITCTVCPHPPPPPSRATRPYEILPLLLGIDMSRDQVQAISMNVWYSFGVTIAKLPQGH